MEQSQSSLSPDSTTETFSDDNTLSRSSSTNSFATGAIAELVRKRKHRILSEKNTTKTESSESTESSENTELSSPPKILKLLELNESVTTSESDTVDESLISLENSSLSLPSSLNVSSLLNRSDSPSIQAKKNVCDKFTEVYGRLSIFKVQKYSVTVGEIARRVYGGEGFNSSLLGSLLRRAKMSNSTAALKAELENAGINLERGRRRNSDLTLFGGFLEGEAAQLGKDFNHLVSTSFPSTQIGQKLAVEALEMKQAPISQKTEQLKAARTFVNEFLDVLSQDSSPILYSYPTRTLEETVQNPLTNFSMLTHGFGNFAIKAVMEAYGKTLDAQIASLS